MKREKNEFYLAFEVLKFSVCNIPRVDTHALVAFILLLFADIFWFFFSFVSVFRSLTNRVCRFRVESLNNMRTPEWSVFKYSVRPTESLCSFALPISLRDFESDRSIGQHRCFYYHTSLSDLYVHLCHYFIFSVLFSLILVIFDKLCFNVWDSRICFS